MLNLVSLAVGGVSLILAILAFFPLLGWANWFILPLPIVGLVLGLFARGTGGRNLNLVVIAICVIRLMISPVI